MSPDNIDPTRSSGPGKHGEPTQRNPALAPPAGPSPSETQPHRRRWIVVSCVLALAVVGLGIWAFSAQSDADDAEAALKSQAARAEATPTPAPAPASSTDEADSVTEQQFEQVKDDLGATSELLEGIEQDLDQAAAKVDAAERAKDDASGTLDGLKADVQAAAAQVELSRACMRGTLDAVGAAFEGGGIDAAVQELQKLAGACKSAATSS